jgi:hypothetical protein
MRGIYSLLFFVVLYSFVGVKFISFHLFILRNEKKFLLCGLKVGRFPTWHERQAAYVAAVKEFLLKMKPEFSEVEVKFVQSIRVDPKLYLDVECGNAYQ